MVYVGYRYVLPAQNSNDWQRNGEVGVYSNWALLSTTHLLQDVGNAALPDYPQYSRSRQLSQVFNGEFAYKPMELAKYSHGGQDAPYLRNPYWEFHGVAGAKAFTASIPAFPAYGTMGAITVPLDYSMVNLTFNLAVDGAAATPVTLTGTYATLIEYIDALNLATPDVTFYEEDSVLEVVSNTVGADAQIVISNVTNGVNSGLEAIDVTGIAATSTWGHDGTRELSTSRHSNWFFYGVHSADATFTGRTAMTWDDPNLPSYARRHAPYTYKGVGDDHLEHPGETLAVKQARAEEGNEYAHQQVNIWDGVTSSKAL